ncbi:MAG: hypothetical protein WA799_06095, partial [Nitrosotalea sp.]
SNTLHTRSGVGWSVLIVIVVELPGLIGFEAKNAMVADDVFFPIHPFANVKDLKFPFLICKVRDEMPKVFEGLLVTWSWVLPSGVFVEVTVTKLDEACAIGMRPVNAALLMINAMRIVDFNNISQRKSNQPLN